MINLISVNSFLETLPAGKYHHAERVLSLKFNSAQNIKSATHELSQKGYLGCLSFARDEIDDMVMVLHPSRSLEKTPIAIASGQFTEGYTIASSLKLFVTGRMAQRNAIAHYKNEILQHAQETRDLAHYFGDTQAINNILASIDQILATEKRVWASQVWAVADPQNPLSQVLAIAWSRKKAELGLWAHEAINIYPDIDIVWRLFVTHHCITNSQVDLTQAMIQLIHANDIFDSTYVSSFSRPGLGTWEIEALVTGVKWLKQKGIKPEVDDLLWEAVQRYAEDPLCYTGEPHFAVAKKYAEIQPEFAYTQLVNAVGFYKRATGQSATEMIQFAYDLASKNNWADLREVISWSL